MPTDHSTLPVQRTVMYSNRRTLRNGEGVRETNALWALYICFRSRTVAKRPENPTYVASEGAEKHAILMA